MKTKMFLEITTGFQKIIDSGDDITKYMEERFHDAVHDAFEDFMTEDEFERRVLDKLIENESLDDKITEFGSLGDVMVSLSDLNVIEAYMPTGKILPKEQKKLELL